MAEYLLPLLNKKGFGILYCGKWGVEDEKNLVKTLGILKGNILKIKNNFLPHNKGIRHNIFIQPKGICPQIYPRKVGKPEKYPLKD